jgi:hypothetical protein
LSVIGHYHDINDNEFVGSSAQSRIFAAASPARFAFQSNDENHDGGRVKPIASGCGSGTFVSIEFRQHLLPQL